MAKKSTNPVGKGGKKRLGVNGAGVKSKALVLVKPSQVKVAARSAPRASAMLAAPAAVAGRMPKIFIKGIAGGNADSFRVAGCEVVTKVASQTQFLQILELAINPRNAALFPRLSAIAAAFEQYSIAKLSFHYVPQSSSARDGSMIHYVEYDPADPAEVTDVDILSNKTKDAVALWQPSTLSCDIRDIHRNRQSFFCQSPIGDSNALTSAEVRQDYAGIYRMYMDGAADANKSCGFLFVDYIVDLLVPRPQPPVSLTAAYKNLAALAIPTNSTAIVPFQSLESSAGLYGGPTVGAGSSYTGIGGVIAGGLDAARQIYESGKWLLTLRANASAPSFSGAPSDKGWVTLADESKTQSEPAEWNASVAVFVGEQPDRVQRYRASRVGKFIPDTSTTITAGFSPYDATTTFDANFPAAVSGMTGISAQSVTAVWDGAGAIVPEVTCELTVPAGSRYVVRPYFTTDVTGAARTLTNVRLSATRLTEAE